MNADWIRGIRVKRVDGIKNIDDIKRDIKEAVDIMKKENKVSKEYNDLVEEICNEYANGNLVQMTTTMEETEMLNDMERDYLEEKLDNLNRIKSEYDKYEWLLDVDPDYDLDAKTQIDISRLRGILHNCLKNCELLKGIGDDVEHEIIESAYNIIKRHCDETGKKLKTLLYIMGDNESETDNSSDNESDNTPDDPTELKPDDVDFDYSSATTQRFRVLIEDLMSTIIHEIHYNSITDELSIVFKTYNTEKYTSLENRIKHIMYENNNDPDILHHINVVLRTPIPIKYKVRISRVEYYIENDAYYIVMKFNKY